MRCATRTCRRGSGAASTSTRTRSSSSASWTSWRRRRARTRSNSGASSWRSIRATSAVLNAVAERIGWGKPAPQGIYRGLAQMKAFNSFVAAACEISVQDGNKVKVHRIVARDRPGLRGQPGADRAPGVGLVRLRPVGAVHAGVHGQGRAHRSRTTSTPTTRCASRRCRRWRRSSCRPAAAIWGGIGEPTICVAAPAVLNAFFTRHRQAPALRAAEEPRHRAGVRRLAACLVAVVAALPCLQRHAAAGDAIPASLTGATGDPARGRAIVANRQVGLCLLCHSGPFPEERFQGNLAPDLRGVGARLSEGQIRLQNRRPEPRQPGHHHAGLLPHRRPRRAWRPPIAARPCSARSRSRTWSPSSMTLK